MLLSNYLLSGGVKPYLEYGWVCAPNAAAQSITANTITTLTIDTEVADTGNFGSVNSSSQITLAAGTYYFEANTHTGAVGRGGGEGTLILFNITDSVYISRGASQSGASDNCDHPILIGQFTISSAKVFELRYYNNAAVTVINSVYNYTSTITTSNASQRTTIKLWKLA